MDKTISQLKDELEAEIDRLYELLKCGDISASDYGRHKEDTANYYNKLIDELITNYYT